VGKKMMHNNIAGQWKKQELQKRLHSIFACVSDEEVSGNHIIDSIISYKRGKNSQIKAPLCYEEPFQGTSQRKKDLKLLYFFQRY
jgi:hypothetical protein